MANGRNIAIGVGVALVTAAGAYGVGWYQGKSRADDAERRAVAASSASASAVSSAGVTLDVERGKVARLEARRRLHLAMIALEDRNFGIAQEHVGSARAFLASAKGADPELQKLGGELEAFKIVATEDVGDQRKALLAFCKRVDDAMPPPKAP
ncbi:MAG: hypothetical protein HYV09_03710 [Deltaproteobacteria bacterium]|nr:hypothetical protein [Deltaproteobacteria bacterium]